MLLYFLCCCIDVWQFDTSQSLSMPTGMDNDSSPIVGEPWCQDRMQQVPMKITPALRLPRLLRILAMTWNFCRRKKEKGLR